MKNHGININNPLSQSLLLLLLHDHAKYDDIAHSCKLLSQLRSYFSMQAAAPYFSSMPMLLLLQLRELEFKLRNMLSSSSG